jgi:hypothetical protein
MVEETVAQMRRLRTIENVEQAIFGLERGIPVPARVLDTLKMLLEVMIIEYNEEMERAAAQEAAPPQEVPAVEPPAE